MFTLWLSIINNKATISDALITPMEYAASINS